MYIMHICIYTYNAYMYLLHICNTNMGDNFLLRLPFGFTMSSTLGRTSGPSYVFVEYWLLREGKKPGQIVSPCGGLGHGGG